MLRSKAYDYAVREQTGVDVLSAVLLVDTFSHNLYVLDSIGIGIYRIRKSGAELILSPHIERSVIYNGFETKHNRVPTHCLSQFEKVASTQCVSTPRWYSCSLKGETKAKLVENRYTSYVPVISSQTACLRSYHGFSVLKKFQTSCLLKSA